MKHYSLDHIVFHITNKSTLGYVYNPLPWEENQTLRHGWRIGTHSVSHDAVSRELSFSYETVPGFIPLFQSCSERPTHACVTSKFNSCHALIYTQGLNKQQFSRLSPTQDHVNTMVHTCYIFSLFPSTHRCFFWTFTLCMFLAPLTYLSSLSHTHLHTRLDSQTLTCLLSRRLASAP